MSTIITKSLRKFLFEISSEYYKLTIEDGRVLEEELTKEEALRIINENHYPLLHKLDNHHMIWGDENFKEECPDYFHQKVNNQCEKKFLVKCDNAEVEINFSTYNVIIKETNEVLYPLQNWLKGQFNYLMINLHDVRSIDSNYINFSSEKFNHKKFNRMNQYLIDLYRVKHKELRSYTNDQLDELLYVLMELDLCPDKQDEINKIIEKRIEKGIYE